jgi:hypothetical protein
MAKFETHKIQPRNHYQQWNFFQQETFLRYLLDFTAKLEEGRTERMTKVFKTICTTDLGLQKKDKFKVLQKIFWQKVDFDQCDKVGINFCHVGKVYPQFTIFCRFLKF